MKNEGKESTRGSFFFLRNSVAGLALAVMSRYADATCAPLGIIVHARDHTEASYRARANYGNINTVKLAREPRPYMTFFFFFFPPFTYWTKDRDTLCSGVEILHFSTKKNDETKVGLFFGLFLFQLLFGFKPLSGCDLEKIDENNTKKFSYN